MNRGSIIKIFCWVLFGTLMFVVVPFIRSAALAQDDVLKLTLKESIDLALKQSMLVDSVVEEINALESGRKEAFTSFLPTLSTSYSYTRLNEAPETVTVDLTKTPPVMKPAPAGTRDNYTWDLTLMQPLFTGGKLLETYRISRLGVDASRLDAMTTVQDLVETVTETYFSILKAERMLDVARQSLDRLEAHLETARSFYEVGMIPRNDLLYAEVEVAGGQQNLVLAENGVQLAKARFNTLLRRDIDLPVEVEDILHYRSFDKEFGACLALGLDSRPEIKAREVRLEQAQRAVSFAKGDYYPSLSVGGTYSRFGDTPGVDGNGYQDRESWYLIAVAEWDLWEWGRTKHSVDASSSRERQARNSLSFVRDQVALEIKSSYLLLREAEKRILVSEKAIEQAEENFRINEERYREQVATSTDVIDAQTLLTKTKSDYFNALSDYNVALKKLERSMGVIHTEYPF